MSHVFHENQQRQKTVLIVEDDISIGEMVTLALHLETSHHIVLAPDASQALELVQKQVPDLLILDYHLPNMNGLEFYNHLQTVEAFRMIPALFLSANAPWEVLEQRNLCYLIKPFEVEVLLQTVEGLLTE